MSRTDKERERRKQEQRKQEQRKQERREFKAKAFLTPGSENPHAKKFARTGKARHRPPHNATEAAMRKQFLAIYGSKGKAAKMAAALYQGHPDGRSHGATQAAAPARSLMIEDQRKRKRK